MSPNTFAQLQYDSAHAAYLQQQLGTLGGLGIGAYNTTAATANALVSTYLYNGAAPEPARAIPAPVSDDEFVWLRARIAEVCWTR